MEAEQKALAINLVPDIYGTLAEIGAGQETARHFFRAGASSGTIAKTMSAYDKTYSDDIYGTEPSGRYVCENRIYKMLNHEFDLLINRLSDSRPDTRFFAFANTVAAINFSKTIKGDGWLGVRFQMKAGGAPNDLIIHARLLDKNNQLQQDAVGRLGVNLIYGCFFYNHNMDALVKSLLDGLEERVNVDLIRLNGPDFEEVDNRSLSFKLVNYGLSDIAMIGPDGNNLHPSEFLYKQHVLVVRGAFKPVTWMNYDIIKAAATQYIAEHEIKEDQLVTLTEITLDILAREHEPDESDFLERVAMLGHLGFIVCISSRGDQQKIIRYLEEFKAPAIGIALTAGYLARYLDHVISTYSTDGLLSQLGEMFTGSVRMYVYPSRIPGSTKVMTSADIYMDQNIRYLYMYLLSSRQIIDILYYNPSVLKISASRVLRMIRDNKSGWEQFIPENIVHLIKDRHLLEYYPTRDSG